MSRFLVFALFVSVSTFMKVSPAYAHSHHTANYCSSTAPDICAHLGFEAEPNTTDEAQFMLDLAPSKVDPALITNVAVKLWMDEMGHGSSPVTLAPFDEAHYEVTKAYFIMSGPWQVKVSFDYGGATHELVIPIDVK
jgi:nitrogen fixation protein FixH